MIRSFKLIRNIGTFCCNTTASSITLNRLVLIHGENGRGKTTLAAVLRSLATGEPMPINERKRLGSSHPPHVVLNCDGNPVQVMFQHGSWNRTLPNVKIFDDFFVDENIYSGLNVDASHRQHLHEFIVGRQGVLLHRRIQELVDCINKHNSALTNKSNAIPAQARGEYTVNAFCALPKLTEINTQIRQSERALLAARNRNSIQSTPSFMVIQMPQFDINGIKQLLLADLPQLDKTAEAKVRLHALSLGDGGESWIAEGVERIAKPNEDICPFCGQAVTGLDLVRHYRAYFDESYGQLKTDIAKMITDIRTSHSEGAQVTFERAVTKTKQSIQYWAECCDISPVEFDTDSIVRDWTNVRNAVDAQLNAKQAAPLEPQQLTTQTLHYLNAYNTHRENIMALNGTLTATNNAIEDVRKQVKLINIEEVISDLASLKATEARFSQKIAPLCEDYLQEVKDKAATEIKRTKARDALEEYRATVSPSLQNGINNYLQRFNAGFRIDSLVPANIGGGAGSTCTYNVVINDMPIAVRRARDTLNKSLVCGIVTCHM